MSKVKKFSYITVFPELIQGYLSDALLAKAQNKGLLQFDIHNLRDFSLNNYKSVDDRPFGGGDGVVFEPEPLKNCLQGILSTASESSRLRKKVIYMSPQGIRCDQQKINSLANTVDHFIFICGRYGGLDQRFIHKYVDEELSIGDYVLSGGELPSLVLTEALSRQIEGVLGDFSSAQNDSFSLLYHGGLEAPQFTRPQVWENMQVPSVLIEGNHQKIQIWKEKMSYWVTLQKRPDLLDGLDLTNLEKMNLQTFYDSLTEDEKNLCGVTVKQNQKGPV